MFSARSVKHERRCARSVITYMRSARCEFFLPFSSSIRRAHARVQRSTRAHAACYRHAYISSPVALSNKARYRSDLGDKIARVRPREISSRDVTLFSPRLARLKTDAYHATTRQKTGHFMNYVEVMYRTHRILFSKNSFRAWQRDR